MFRYMYLVTLLSFGGCSLYQFEVGNWADPPEPTVLQITTNATGALRVGDIIEFNCTALNHSSNVATLEWRQAIGIADFRVAAGRSPLTWEKEILATDHGTRIFCGTGFTNRLEDNRLLSFYAKSDYMDLLVQGVTSTPQPPNSNGQNVFVNIRPQVQQTKVGDILEYVCDVENMIAPSLHPSVEMKQRKGHVERQIYFGYQTGFRWLRHNITLADADTVVFCQAWLLDSRYNSYAINSEVYTLNVV